LLEYSKEDRIFKTTVKGILYLELHHRVTDLIGFPKVI
jgi:hypothetical protein